MSSLSLLLCSCLTAIIFVTPEAGVPPFDLQQLESNKILTDFIWSKIIAASSDNNNEKLKSQLQSLSSNLAPMSLMTIPLQNATRTPAFTRRSSYPLSSQSSSSSSSASSSSSTSSTSPSSSSGSKTPVPAASVTFQNKVQSNNYFSGEYDRSSPSKGQSSFTFSSQTSTNNHQSKPSDAFSQEKTSYYDDGIESIQKKTSPSSLYDILPMPSYGYGKSSEKTISKQQQPQYQAQRTLEIVPMINEGKERPYGPQPQMEPQIIDVMPDDQPIQLVFRSHSTPVKVKQIHTPLNPEEVETTRTEESPQRVMHHLLRPIIQEVLEVIQPYRRVTQEVRPVLEEIHTVVSKHSDDDEDHRRGRGRGGGDGYGSAISQQYLQQHRDSYGKTHHHGKKQNRKLQNYG